MFGALRFLLALMVVVSHLAGSRYFAHFGFYAVRGFFVLSGFLMTAGLNEIYAFDAKRFWTNRLLRLLPPYYLVCLFTLAVIHHFPAQAAAYLDYWKPGLAEPAAFTNFFIIPLEFPVMHFRLVPPYWSVAVELQMYGLLFVAAARSERLAMTALCLGLVYHFACMAGDLGFGARYSAAPSAILSFASGAVIYFWMKRGELNVAPRAAAIALVMWVGNTIAGQWLLSADYAYGAGYYLSTFFFVIVVAGLANLQWGPVASRIDRALGDIAYPTFLLQWLAGFVAALIIGADIWRGWTLFCASIPVLLFMAVMLAFLNSKFIEPLRTMLRNGIALPPSLRMQEASVIAEPGSRVGAG